LIAALDVAVVPNEPNARERLPNPRRNNIRTTAKGFCARRSAVLFPQQNREFQPHQFADHLSARLIFRRAPGAHER
jgi:hypothetical protein